VTLPLPFFERNKDVSGVILAQPLREYLEKYAPVADENRMKWLTRLLRVGGRELREAAKETALSTRYVESHFGQLPGVGDKPTQHEIKGFTVRLDALIKLSRMGRDELGFSIRKSKRKRKFPESADLGWNDGNDDGRFERDMLRRVKGYVTGKGGTARGFAKQNLTT